MFLKNSIDIKVSKLRCELFYRTNIRHGHRCGRKMRVGEKIGNLSDYKILLQ